MTKNDAVSALLTRPNFGDGEWHRLHELLAFETHLLAVRQADDVFSGAVRIDGSQAKKLRRDELIAFMYFAQHEGLPDSTPFRKPIRDVGIDIEYERDGAVDALQITTACAVFLDSRGQPLNGGYQHRCSWRS